MRRLTRRGLWLGFFFVGLAVTMLLGQIGEQHFAHQGRALGFADHQDAVDHQGAVDFFVHQLEVQFVGDRQTEQIGERGAIEGRQQRARHERAELRWIRHVGEHLHHADQGADHAEGRRAVADRAVDLLAFVEMGEEVVAVALEIVADEIGVVAVGDEADAFGEEGIVGLDFFQADRPGLAGDFGDAGDFIDQFALGHAPHREGKFSAERQAVHDGGERKTDQSSGKRPTENDDERMFADEHVQIAAHHNHKAYDSDAAQQA